MTTVNDMRTRLDLLTAEHFAARQTGLDRNATYMDDLEADLAAAREAYVGLAVTEIATLRAQLSGALQG